MSDNPNAPLFKPSEGVPAQTRDIRAANQETVIPNASDQWLRKIDLTLFGSAGGETGTGAKPGATVSGDSGGRPPDTMRFMQSWFARPRRPTTREDDPDLSTTIAKEATAKAAEGAMNLTPDDFVQFQIKFNIRKTTTQTPNIMSAKIYNLSPDSMNKMQLYKKVTLSAGYQTGRYGMIFNGNVVRYTRGRDNATDTYLEVIAGDGDVPNTSDVFRKVFDEGTELKIIIEEVAKMTGIKESVIDIGNSKEKLSRAMSVFGMNKDILRKHALTLGADFWVENEKLYFLVQEKYVPGTAVVLSPTTGLIGIPEATPQGIKVRCLLNPAIRLGGLIELRSDYITGIPYLPGSQGPITDEAGVVKAQELESASLIQQLPMPAFTSPTGTYKVVLLDFTGETRGTPWYCDMTCIALDKSGEHITSRHLPYNRINTKETGVAAPKAGVVSVTGDSGGTAPPTLLRRSTAPRGWEPPKWP